MDKIQIVYQRNEENERFAGLTLAQVAKALWRAWTKSKEPDLCKRQVCLFFASNTDDKFEVSSHHGLLMQAPFDSPMLITGGCGGYDFGAAELVEAEDDLGCGTAWEDLYPDMTRGEAVVCKTLETLMWNEWTDEKSLLWCDVEGCIEDYLDSLPDDEKEVISELR